MVSPMQDEEGAYQQVRDFNLSTDHAFGGCGNVFSSLCDRCQNAAIKKG